jgi:hypothetical protein
MKYQSISVPTQHQIRVAKNTLHLSDAGARALGGMTKDAAREVLALEAVRAARATLPTFDRGQR